MREAAAPAGGPRALPGARPVGLLLRGPLPPAGAARRHARARSGGSSPPRASSRSSRSSACRSPSTACSTTARWSSHGGRILGVGAQDLPAELPRVLRAAPVHAGRRGVARRRSSCAGSATCRSARGSCSSSRTSRCFAFHVEICEDLWVPIPPSSYAALAGATVLAQPVGVERHRRQGRLPPRARSAASRRAASPPISTPPPAPASRPPTSPGTATRFDLRERHAARRVASASPTSRSSSAPTSTSSGSRRSACARTASASRSGASATRSRSFRTVAFAARAAAPSASSRSSGATSVSPTCPPTRRRATSAAQEVYHIQVQGLVKRLRVDRHRARGDRRLRRARLDAGAARLRAGDGRAGLPRANILAYTMPGFATSARTLDQARQLMQAVGRERRARSTSARSCLQMLKDIGHPYARGRARSTTSPSRTCRPASAPATSSASPTSTTAWWWHRRPLASSRSAGAPTASATTCRTTTSTPACPRR